MRTLNSEGVLRRLVEVLLPAGGGLVVMHEGYFDESGDLDREPGVFCISGYYIASEAATAMDAAWGAVLDEFEIPYFHMVDCAHGVGIFEDMCGPRRVELVKRLIQLIKDYTLEGFSAVCNAEYFAASGHGPDAYSLSASMCISALRSHPPDEQN